MDLLEKLLPNDKITASCQSNMSPKHYIKHVNNKQEFENSVILQQVFKHHNCSLFQSSSSLSIPISFFAFAVLFYLL